MNIKYLGDMFLVSALALSWWSSASQAASTNVSQTYPCIVGDSTNSDCAVVLKAAELAFKSKSSQIYDGGTDVRRQSKTVVLWPTSDSLEFDPAVIERKDSGEARVYLQKRPVLNTRFVSVQKPFNWQGDWFDIALDRSNDNEAAIATKVASVDLGNTVPKGMQVVMSGGWQKPWMFSNPSNGHVIAVDTHHPADFMADWDIYAPDKKGTAIMIGKIQFAPHVDSVLKALPTGSVKDFGVLLDKILGVPKNDEGTYQATARTRGIGQTALANAYYRPWAIATPNSSRAAVDKHLKRWSRGSRVYKQQYDKLQMLYPQTVAAFTAHYEKTFQKPHGEAAAMAAKSTDQVLRSYFAL